MRKSKFTEERIAADLSLDKAMLQTVVANKESEAHYGSGS